MKTSSPLRYPGGKSALADLLGRIRTLNDLNKHSMAEPYAGGAGASLTLLYLEYTKEIYINDADKAIYNFWWSLLTCSERFIEEINCVDVTIDEWFRQREIYRKPSGVGRFERGFATFFLNRCNISGIIVNGGPIGGIDQTGKWKIHARFNKEELGKRCMKVAEYQQRILASHCDGIKFIDSVDAQNTMFFIDPPYFKNGAKLYLDALDVEYHRALADKLYTMRDMAWILTYDDCPANLGDV